MAFESYEKELVLLRLKKIVADCKEAAAITDFGDIDTDLTAMETAFSTDPATLTATMLYNFRAKLNAITFARADTLSDAWSEVNSEYAIENP